MSTIAKLHVEIDDRIKQNPELYALVQSGTEYFESEFQDMPADPLWGKAHLEWYPTPGRFGFLSLRFSEEHMENGGYLDLIQLPQSQLIDEVSRNTWMRRLLSRVVIKHRTKVASDRMNRFILELGNTDG
jgi:hypothetical protein